MSYKSVQQAIVPGRVVMYLNPVNGLTELALVLGDGEEVGQAEGGVKWLALQARQGLKSALWPSFQYRAPLVAVLVKQTASARDAAAESADSWVNPCRPIARMPFARLRRPRARA
jgi:hypothetical protein